MAFKMRYKNLKAVVEELRGAVKAHGKQADTIEKHIDSMEGEKKSGLKKTKKRTLTASCKAAAKRKFKKYPSAYANMWASRQQGKGKC
tara:strand:+ start:374 stop:637 length:264 start_codon:yes stop_codon:yes gene_type:complete